MTKLKAITGEIPVTVGRIAEIFEVTPKTVRDWLREGLPTLKAGGKGSGNGAIIDLAAAVTWYLSDSGELDPGQQRARKDSEMADKLAMENAKRRGELLEGDIVSEAWTGMLANARSRLLSMPSKLGPRLLNIPDPAVVSETIRVEVYAALTELATDPDYTKEVEFSG